MNHQTSSVPEIAYQSPQASTQPMTKLPFVDSSLFVPVFSPGDDRIACLNKAMAFLTTIASLRSLLTNNHLRTSSNSRHQAIIQDDMVIVQQVQGRQGKSYSGNVYKGNPTSSGGNNASGHARVVKCYNCQGEGHMARQCTQSKRPRNVAWFKDKAMLPEAQKARNFLDEEQLAFLVDPGIPDGQAVQTIIPNMLLPRLKILILMILTVIMSQMQKRFSWLIFPTMVLTLSRSAHVNKASSFYDNIHKQALGYQNPFYLKKAQRIKPTLYDGIVISNKHVAMPVIDDVETLILEEESRSKMSEKEKDPEAIKQKISYKPIDYLILNQLSKDFRKHFVPQQELLAKQAFWYHMSNPSTESSDASPVKMESPKKLPKVSLVNESLKMFKFHNAKFDNVVKIRTTPDTRTLDILNEIIEVQTIFDQMEAAVQQSLVEKQCLKIAKKELLLKNDRLLQQIMSQDVLLTVMNSMFLNGLKRSTSNCKSKPTCNKKNDRISQTPSKNIKNKVEAQPRKFNKKNRMVEPIHDVDVKHSLLNLNSKLICATCKKSIFDGIHDMCLLDFVKNVNSRAKSAKKHKNQNIWKPTGHVFTEVGLKWKPTGKTFTNVGNSCPLTRITSANIVPPKKTTSHSIKTQKPKLKVYSRKPKNVKNVGLSKKAKIVKSKNANHSEPNNAWGSNAIDIPSSFSLVMTGYGDYQLGNVTNSKVYYVKGIGHNLFSVVLDAAAPRAVVLFDSPVSTFIDHDALSASILMKLLIIGSTTLVTSLFFWQWELSSLAVETSPGSGNSITGSGNALCILFPTILP
nr:hypothetical protein [Tanacetum cinerariifolium]